MARILTDNTLITKGEVNEVEVVTETTTSRTLGLTDAFKVIKTTNGSAVTIEIPANATTAFPIGTEIIIEQWGAGAVTIDPAVGVTMNSEGGADQLAAQYASAYLRKDDTNTWILIGNITT